MFKKTKIHTALVHLLLNQLRTTGISNLVMLSLVTFVIWQKNNDLFILQWMSVGYALIGIRIVVLFLSGLQNKLNIIQLERLIAFFIILSGLHWGVSAWIYLDPQDPELFVFLSAVYLGIVASTIPSMAARPFIWLAYSLSIFLFAFTKFAFLQEWNMLALILVGQFINTLVSFNLSRQIKHSITQDLRNEELLEEVNQAKEKAENANLTKSKFMASATHDLRQPLHVQSVLLEVLNLHLKNDDLKKIVGKIAKSNLALTNLFNSLLEISQLDAGTLKTNLSHQNLNKLCQNLFEEYQILAHLKGLEFNLEQEECTVISDPILLNRILSNLLSNALKFTQTGSISITIKNKSDKIEISIYDTGIGIDSSEHENVFNEYVQIGNQERDRSQGIGLGLALVSRLCQLLHHEIKLTSQLSKGCEFKLILAKGEQSNIVTVDMNINQSQIKNTQILLIDDEKDIIEAMTLMLTNWGAKVKGMLSIDEALTDIKDNNYAPELIISDYRLKNNDNGLDGLTLIQKKLGRTIPSLIITGDTDPELLEKIKKENLYILHKPVKIPSLKKAINILLKQSI